MRWSALAAAAMLAACRPSAPPGPTEKPPHDAPSATDPAGAAASDAAPKLASADAGASSDAAVAIADSDPMSLHKETREDLLALFAIKDFTDEEKKRIQPDIFLRSTFGIGSPGKMSQGNKAIAQHTISKEKCLAGLKDIVIQTPEQRDKCGAENMVPVWIKGKDPWFCIDVFEFPNKACELPMVWTPPTMAKKVCELQGKRLCSDMEWNIACRGDPAGGDDWRYAYGNKVDIEICHTNLRHRTACNPRDAKSTFASCTTDTEPSGSFPKCRSRFGVFDQHGNVAEVMMRREGDRVFTQLKGSAWFYNELVREPDAPIPETTTNKAGAYPDHCNFNPRWHVEPIDAAWHVNYHLGFRCCKSIP
ncbi:MAG: SUMF1/EgtB/PvdO family nonheme iron enzyme [Labilithrix sp.]|nr:SUMF1/EgtB/PvdO family nonheme iron enzyme [Labilithrix sp.]